ncbi:MAG: AEC family transporter [Gammaproteobacteria bacterium]|nr:AEC family transporter [Gammaproteobacteria bacterium]
MQGAAGTLLFALSITGPIMLMLAMGALLARWGILTDAFIEAGSRLVFNVLLPVLLFIIISKTRFEQTANLALIVVGVIGTLLAFAIMEVLAARLVKTPVNRGVVVQGAFRANLGVIGLAYAVNAYGDIAMAASSLYLAIVTALYNVLAVITLDRSPTTRGSALRRLTAIGRNPLIIGIVAALPVAYFEIPIPGLVLQTGQYFAQMALPLALLCAGGSLSLSSLHLESGDAITGTLGKVLLSPLILTAVGYVVGLRGMELGIVFLMASAPTAASSYPMARAMGGNASLAANIIVLSTIGSVVATTLGMVWLKASGLV